MIPDAGPPVLRLEGIHAAYRSFKALFDVSLEVPSGTAVALVGANGAGKSTVARVASGLVQPTAGKVYVDGDDFTGRPVHDFARCGVAHAPEGRALFGTLTVEENLRLAFRNATDVEDVPAALDEAFDLFPKLRERRAQTAGTMSGGEQRMLTLARVLVLQPRLVIADELSLGLAPLVIHEVYETLHRIHDAGCSLLVVEQRLDHALDLADEVVVIERGEITFRGSPEEAHEMQDAMFTTAGRP